MFSFDFGAGIGSLPRECLRLAPSVASCLPLVARVAIGYLHGSTLGYVVTNCIPD